MALHSKWTGNIWDIYDGAQVAIRVDSGATNVAIPTGSALDIESGGVFKIDGVTVTASAAALNAAGGAVTNLDVGADGTAGTFDLFPTTAANGKIAFTATDMGGAWNLGITNDAIAAARAYTIPDAGGDGKFVMTTEANSLLVDVNTANRTMSLSGNVSLAGALTTAAAVEFTGAFAASFTVPSASTWILPTGGGTLALATGAETGTTESSFTVDSDSAAAKIALNTNSATGDFTLSIVPANLTANRTVTIQDAAQTLVGRDTTDTLTAKTLTTPVINGATTSVAANNFDLNTSTGTFKTPSGITTLYGNVVTSGNPTFSFAGSSGTFDSSTGTNTLNGNVVIAGTKTLTTGTGAATLKGSATFDATKTLTFGAAAGGTNTPITMYSVTANKGALIIDVDDAATDHTTTLKNGAVNGASITCTLPITTCTIAGNTVDNAFTAVQTVTLDDTTDGIVNGLVLKHSSSDNNATALDGLGISVHLENATGTSTVEEWASIDAISTTITNGSEDGDWVFSQMLAGTVTESARLDSSDQSLTIGRNSTDANGMYQLRIFPVTASKGSLRLQAVANTGDTDLIVTNVAQGGANTAQVPDLGAGVTDQYVFEDVAQTLTNKTISGASNTLSAIARANLAEDALAKYTIGVPVLRSNTGLALDATGGAGLFKVTNAGIGTGTQTVDGEAASGNSKTDIVQFEFALPPEYVAAGDVKVIAKARESVGAATVATTLSGEAYEDDSQGGVSANLLGAWDQTDVTASWQTFTASVTATSLTAGDKLRIYLQIVTNDTGGAVGTVAQIGQVQMQCDVKG